MNNKTALWLLIIIAIVGGGYYFFLTNKQADKIEVVKEVKISKGDLITKELANKYQALTDWEKDEDLVYTLKLEERLIIDKPILFRGELDDIFGHDGKIFVRFDTYSFGSVRFLELECDKQIVDKIITQEPFSEFAIVAKVQNISKPAFEIMGSVLSEEEVEIDIDSSDSYIAKGVCVDVAYIPQEKYESQ